MKNIHKTIINKLTTLVRVVLLQCVNNWTCTECQLGITKEVSNIGFSWGKIEELVQPIIATSHNLQQGSATQFGKKNPLFTGILVAYLCFLVDPNENCIFFVDPNLQFATGYILVTLWVD